MTAAVLSLTFTSATVAKDTKASPKPAASGAGTGVVAGGPPPGFNDGVTVGEKQAKTKSLDAYKALVVAKSGGKTALVAAAGSITDAKGSLTWNQGIHQQNSYYCVVAVVQTMAYRDISSSYLTLGTSSVKGAQDKIYAIIKDPYQLGSDDWLGRKWINDQYIAHGLPWRYVGVTPGTKSDFWWYAKYDIALHNEGSYLRIDLSSGYYLWTQPRTEDRYGNTSVPEHATMAIAYDTTRDWLMVYDPLSYDDGRGNCYFSGTPGYTWSCGYLIGSSRLYSSMDRVYAPSDAPFWW